MRCEVSRYKLWRCETLGHEYLRCETSRPKLLRCEILRFKILPRDLRLLKTRGANIAVRPDYFLFRLPPFTGCVRRDSCLLLTDGPSAATDVLQDSLLSQIKLPTEEDQLQTTPFELRVLETALREDLLSKQERFTRLAALIHP